MAPPVADPEGDTIPGVPWPHSLQKKQNRMINIVFFCGRYTLNG